MDKYICVHMYMCTASGLLSSDARKAEAVTKSIFQCCLKALRAPAASLTCISQHTSAYVSIRQHTSAASLTLSGLLSRMRLRPLNRSPTCIRHHASAYVIRQHTSAHVSICQHTSAYVSIRQHTSACVSTRQHPSASVSIRQHTLRIHKHPGAYVRALKGRSTTSGASAATSASICFRTAVHPLAHTPRS